MDKALRYLPIVEVLILPALVYLVLMAVKFQAVATKVDTIMNNHLPHIDSLLAELRNDIRSLWVAILQNKE